MASSEIHNPSSPVTVPNLTNLLSDEILLRILSSSPSSSLVSSSLVSKRLLRLSGHLRHTVVLLNWSSLPLLPSRFPNISNLNLVPASFPPPPVSSPILLSRSKLSISVPSGAVFGECSCLDQEAYDEGLKIVADAFPGLRRLSILAVASEDALLNLAEKCQILQELDLHKCSDSFLHHISAFSNLQILRLVATVEGVYTGPGITDIGLTILAHGCKRLVKLEFDGSEGSYAGISAIGTCCFMLEELTISHHQMDAGWMAGLSCCENLKTLKFVGCRNIDLDPGPDEHLGSCPTVERLHLQRCQLRDKRSFKALFTICDKVRDILLQDCWGLTDDIFSITSSCRRVRFLSLHRCSLLTTEGLQSVVLSWNELQHLSVISCNKVKDSEVSSGMSDLFSILKELKWRPDSRSFLKASLKGTGMGKKGAKFFKRT